MQENFLHFMGLVLTLVEWEKMPTGGNYKKT
jgi:hypothetical protein